MNEFDRQNNDLWKWGIIYVNPNDPDILVRKREQAMGWTLNFAHRESYAFVALVLLAPLLLILVMSWI